MVDDKVPDSVADKVIAPASGEPASTPLSQPVFGPDPTVAATGSEAKGTAAAAGEAGSGPFVPAGNVTEGLPAKGPGPSDSRAPQGEGSGVTPTNAELNGVAAKGSNQLTPGPRNPLGDTNPPTLDPAGAKTPEPDIAAKAAAAPPLKSTI